MRDGTARFAILGAGFWAHSQLAAWRELPDVACCAVCDPDPQRAAALADRFEIAARYADPEQLLDEQSVDFVDIVSSPHSHEQLVLLCARHKLPVICQKPMSEQLDACTRMCAACERAGVWFAVHENWRWQAPLRRLKQLLDQGAIGRLIRGRIDMISAFDVFANQPALADQPRMIISDLGCHLLDYARCLFGEAERVYCETSRVRGTIRGEDTASILLRMRRDQCIVLVQMAYAGTPLEHECFPQTLVSIEGTQGSIVLAPDYRLRITTSRGTTEERAAPRSYAWTDEQYLVVQSSLVDCQRHLLDAMRQGRPAETCGRDNLQSMRLMFAAYESAATEQAVHLSHADLSEAHVLE